MDLTFGKEELAFQQEVRDWLKENLTPEIQGEIKVGRNAYMPKERLVDWQKRLAKKGWLCTGWHKEFGGPGFTTTQKYIFEMEMARADSRVPRNSVLTRFTPAPRPMNGRRRESDVPKS